MLGWPVVSTASSIPCTAGLWWQGWRRQQQQGPGGAWCWRVSAKQPQCLAVVLLWTATMVFSGEVEEEANN